MLVCFSQIYLVNIEQEVDNKSKTLHIRHIQNIYIHENEQYNTGAGLVASPFK